MAGATGRLWVRDEVNCDLGDYDDDTEMIREESVWCVIGCEMMARQ